jgi:hypothetical protein
MSEGKPAIRVEVNGSDALKLLYINHANLIELAHDSNVMSLFLRQFHMINHLTNFGGI